VHVFGSLRKTHGLTLDGLGRVEIHADEGDVARAKELLEAADSGEFALADDEDDEKRRASVKVGEDKR